MFVKYKNQKIYVYIIHINYIQNVDTEIHDFYYKI